MHCVTFLLGLLCRFGSFEIFKTRDPLTGRTGPSVGRVDILHQLLDYTIEMFYPEVCKPWEGNSMDIVPLYCES